MTLENAFNQLVEQLDLSRVAFEELRMLVLEDHPQVGTSAVIGDLGDESALLIGLLSEALESARASQRRLDQHQDIGGAMLALVACQSKFGESGQTMQNGLLSFRKLSRLRRVGWQNKGEWLEWARIIHKDIDRCQQRLQETDLTLLQCWKELAERQHYLYG